MFSNTITTTREEQYDQLIWGYNVAAFGLAAGLGLGGLALGVI